MKKADEGMEEAHLPESLSGRVREEACGEAWKSGVYAYMLIAGGDQGNRPNAYFAEEKIGNTLRQA